MRDRGEGSVGRLRYAALYDHLEWRGLRYCDVKGVFKPKVIVSCPDFANN
jgi:hypothetical protein